MDLVQHNDAMKQRELTALLSPRHMRDLKLNAKPDINS